MTTVENLEDTNYKIKLITNYLFTKKKRKPVLKLCWHFMCANYSSIRSQHVAYPIIHLKCLPTPVWCCVKVFPPPTMRQTPLSEPAPCSAWRHSPCEDTCGGKEWQAGHSCATFFKLAEATLGLSELFLLT